MVDTIGHLVSRRQALRMVGLAATISLVLPSCKANRANFGVIKGGNIAPMSSQFTGDGVWDTFWTNWRVTWSWIQKNIELAVHLGANTVRLIGSFGIVGSKRIRIREYLDRQAQVAEYCHSLGVKYYACGGGLRDIRSASLDDIRSLLLAQASNFSQFGETVMGFDLVNEYADGFERMGRVRVEQFLVSALQRIRSTGIKVPLTVSDNRPPPKKGAELPAIASLIDFWDFHIYGAVPGPGAFRLLIEISNLPIVIGEFGVDRTDGKPPSERGQFYKDILKLQRSIPRIQGSLQWAIVSNQYGLYDESTMTLQSDIASAWESFPSY